MTTQLGFRLTEYEIEIIDSHARRLEEATKVPCTRTDALRAILSWFADRERVRARFGEALARVRAEAKELGLDKLTEEEINAEIRAARKERKR